MPRKPPRDLITDLLRQGRLASQPPKKRRGRLPTTAKKQRAVVKKQSAKMQRAVKRAVADTKIRTPVARIAAALEARNVDEAVAAVPWEDVGAKILEAGHGVIYQETYNTAALIEAAALRAQYAVLDSHALDAMRAAGAQFVTQITERTRTELREILVDTMNRGLSTRQTAVALKQKIGLTARLAKAVDNYEAALIEEGRNAEQITRMVERKAEQLLNYRARTIATQEANAALVSGQQEAWRQAREAGLIDSSEMEQMWLTSSTPCPAVCEPANGQRQPLGGLFEMGDGSRVSGPPAHVNCLCGIVLVPVAASESKAA